MFLCWVRCCSSPRVNFMSAWGLCIWWNLRPHTMPVLKGKDRGKKGEKVDQRKDKESNWLRNGHSSIWLIIISIFYIWPFFIFSYSLILPKLLFGHLRIKINVSKTIVVKKNKKLWDYFRQTKFNEDYVERWNCDHFLNLVLLDYHLGI